jgi:hypothetical protein
VKLTLATLHHYCTECGDCLLWANGVNSTGYPQARIDGDPETMVRRYVFTRLLGREIPPRCVVATRCDNRLCIAPGHLIAMKRGKVQERSYAKGKRMHSAEYMERLRCFERRGLTVLNWDLVRYIRSLPVERTHAEIARELNVSQNTVAKVRRGLSWRESYGPTSIFALGVMSSRLAPPQRQQQPMEAMA